MKKRFSIKTYRRITQLSVFIAFILIPYLNLKEIHFVRGNFLSFYIGGITLADPLAVLQVSLKNWYLSPRLLMGAGIVLLIAFSLGTLFCSWICPFGFMSELVQGLRKKRQKIDKPDTLRKGFVVKLYIFAIGFTGFFFFSTTPVLNQLSLPAWYSRIFQFLFTQHHLSMAIFVLLFILFIEFLAGKRLWCKYICPQAIFLVTFKLLNPYHLKIGYNKDKCICRRDGNEPCKAACSLSLDPQLLSSSLETECNNCGDCVVACKKRGAALQYQFDRYKRAKPETSNKDLPHLAPTKAR